MTVREDVKILLAKENLTITELAEKLSKKYNKKYSMAGLSQKLVRSTMKYDEVKQIAEVLGYKIKFEK